MPLYRNIISRMNAKDSDEERQLGTIGSELNKNIDKLLINQYRKLPEDFRTGLEEGTAANMKAIQQWNVQKREENTWGGIGPLDPLIGVANTYNAVVEPAKKELSRVTGLDLGLIDKAEIAIDVATGGKSLVKQLPKFDIKAAARMLDEVFDARVTNKVTSPFRTTQDLLTGGMFGKGGPGTGITGGYQRTHLFKSKEKLQELNNYIEEAFQHRQGRVEAGGKQNLMKGYDRSIFNESGQEYILVKRSRLKDSKNVASKSNYVLRNKKDLEFEIAARSGFEVKQDKDVKYLKMIVSELNKIEQQNPKLYLSTLMEYGDKAYLEHKVARRQFNWFWQRVEGNRPGDTFGKWVGTNNRNTEKNLRLLLDHNYKTLKDTTEVRLKKFDNPSLPDEERLVITIEDPNEALFSAKSLFVRSNPGNILIKKAGSGETIGVVPDFYRQIYSTQFANAFKKNKNALSGSDVPEFLKVKGGEDITAYRDRIINKMIDDAIKGKVSMLGYEERYLEELADFYNTFTKLESKTGRPWVRKPSWVEEILETTEFNISDTEDLTYKPISSLSRSEQINLQDLKDNLKTSLENKKVYESQFSKQGKTRTRTAITDKDYRKILRNISKYREEIKNILYQQKSLFDK